MSLVTNSHFISASAAGTDWRDTAKNIVEDIKSVLTEGKPYSLGLVYVTDHLAQDIPSILNLFKSVLNIPHWGGSIGIGVLDINKSYINEPAISVLLLDIPEGEFMEFRFGSMGNKEKDKELAEWLVQHDPLLVLTHAGSAAGGLSLRLKELEGLTRGYLVGGVASACPSRIEFAGNKPESDLSGICFSDKVGVATSLTQGCSPIGEYHTITQVEEEHIIEQLDDVSCYEVFQDDLRALAMDKLGKDPNDIIITSAEEGDEQSVWDEIPSEFQDVFHGEVHVAFPVMGTDQNDFMVRNILNMNYEAGGMAVAQHVYNGDRVMFVHRNQDTMKRDLTRMLIELRQRVENEQGGFYPKGAVYISCMARAGYDFGEDYADELALIREVIGEIPLVGFYAGGEILSGRIYGHTGILNLFL
jgi:small ligand-binding sensory domain FIST